MRIEKAVKELDKTFAKANSKICRNCSECCCQDCAYQEGYFVFEYTGIEGSERFFRLDYDFTSVSLCDIYSKKAILKAKKLLRQLKKKYGWDKKLGFLDPKKGCRLPRGKRSIVCLKEICDSMAEFMATKHPKKSKGYLGIYSSPLGLKTLNLCKEIATERIAKGELV